MFQGRADVVVEGRVERTGDAWTVTLEMRTSRGEPVGTREIQSEAEACSGLDESLALVVALMIDVSEESIRLSLPTRPRPAGWRFETEVGAAAALGFLPGASIGLRVALAVDPPWAWPLVVDGVVWADEEVADAQGGAGLEARQVGLSICPPVLRSRHAAVAPCLGGGAAAIRATGFDFRENDDQAVTFPFVSAGARATFPLAGPLVAAADLAAFVPLLRPRFFYEDLSGVERSLYRLPPVAGVATLGIAVALP